VPPPLADPPVTGTPASSPAPTSLAGESAENWARLTQQIINDIAFRQYATVQRSDGSYRQMFIDERTLTRWLPSQPLPQDTLIVMETFLTPGEETTNFTKHLEADGEFTYGSFSPARPSFATRRDTSCIACHRLSVDKAGTFTLPLLRGAVTDGVLMTARCDQSGRTPCGPETYRTMVPATPLTEGER
jgi:hypothetical protein